MKLALALGTGFIAAFITASSLGFQIWTEARTMPFVGLIAATISASAITLTVFCFVVGRLHRCLMKKLRTNKEVESYSIRTRRAMFRMGLIRHAKTTKGPNHTADRRPTQTTTAN